MDPCPIPMHAGHLFDAHSRAADPGFANGFAGGRRDLDGAVGFGRRFRAFFCFDLEFAENQRSSGLVVRDPFFYFLYKFLL